MVKCVRCGEEVILDGTECPVCGKQNIQGDITPVVVKKEVKKVIKKKR